MAALAGQDGGSWTAKYYEITQVLSRVQTRARGWFSQPIFTKRSSLIALLAFILILSAFLYAAFDAARSTSDAWLRATIAAVYTDTAPRSGTSQDPSLVETVVSGTLHAMDIASVSIVDLQTPIPVTGGELTPTDQLFGTLDPSGSGTPGRDGTPNSTPINETPGPIVPTSTLTMVKTSPAPTLVDSPTPSPTPSATSSPTITPTATVNPTETFEPSHTPTFTPLPIPTEDICSMIQLTSFGVQALEINYTLSNSSTTSVEISRIDINWPTKNQEIKIISVAGNVVWDGGDQEPPTTALGVGSVLGQSSSTQLIFTFKRSAGSTGYSLNVTLTNGCTSSRVD
jgi:hypothetical protein